MIFGVGHFYELKVKAYIPVFVAVFTTFIPPAASFWYLVVGMHGIFLSIGVTTLTMAVIIWCGSTPGFLVFIAAIFIQIFGTYRLNPVQRLLMVMLNIGFAFSFVSKVAWLCDKGLMYEIQKDLIFNPDSFADFCSPEKVNGYLSKGDYDGLANAWICQPDVYGPILANENLKCDNENDGLWKPWPTDFIANDWNSDRAKALNDFMGAEEICVEVHDVPWHDQTVSIRG